MLAEDNLFNVGDNRRRRDALRARGWQIVSHRTRGGAFPSWMDPGGKVWTDEYQAFTELERLERRDAEARGQGSEP